jgi:putative DNA primase/helicase
MTEMQNAQSIVKALGGRWCGRYGMARCPAHDDQQPSLKVSDNARRLDGIDLHCFRGCDWKDIKAELQRRGLLESEPSRWLRTAQATPARVIVPADDDAAQRARVERAIELWRQSKPLIGTLGHRYFTRHRELAIDCLNLDHVIRWHVGMCAVIALMTDPVTNAPTGIHRTFLNTDGSKRERKMLGRQGVLRLSPDEDVLEGLGICEGVETGLRILLDGWSPIWCATSAGGIERLPTLGGIEALTIFTDDDGAGMSAARACSERWTAADREVRLAQVKDAFNGI